MKDRRLAIVLLGCFAVSMLGFSIVYLLSVVSMRETRQNEALDLGMLSEYEYVTPFAYLEDVVDGENMFPVLDDSDTTIRTLGELGFDIEFLGNSEVAALFGGITWHEYVAFGFAGLDFVDVRLYFFDDSESAYMRYCERLLLTARHTVVDSDSPFLMKRTVMFCSEREPVDDIVGVYIKQGSAVLECYANASNMDAFFESVRAIACTPKSFAPEYYPYIEAKAYVGEFL